LGTDCPCDVCVEMADVHNAAMCDPTQVPKWRYSGGDWVLDDFDEWSELTKERDAYRADAEAEWHRNPYA
jgi:hypothetical protein